MFVVFLRGRRARHRLRFAFRLCLDFGDVTLGHRYMDALVLLDEGEQQRRQCGDHFLDLMLAGLVDVVEQILDFLRRVLLVRDEGVDRTDGACLRKTGHAVDRLDGAVDDVAEGAGHLRFPRLQVGVRNVFQHHQRRPDHHAAGLVLGRVEHVFRIERHLDDRLQSHGCGLEWRQRQNADDVEAGFDPGQGLLISPFAQVVVVGGQSPDVVDNIECAEDRAGDRQRCQQRFERARFYFDADQVLQPAR